MTEMAAAGLSTGVFAGATIQRLTGLGFSLVAAPFLVLACGAWSGIGLLYLLGTVSCSVIGWQLRRSVPIRLVLQLFWSAAVGALIGSIVAWCTSARPLAVGIGLVVLSVGLVLVLAPSVKFVDRPSIQWGSGFGCGLLSGIAGVGGPILAFYGLAADVPRRRLMPAMQITFALLGVVTLMIRFAIGGSPLPHLAVWLWITMAVMIYLGDRAGSWVSRFISDELGLRIMLGTAFLGALTLIVRALVKV